MFQNLRDRDLNQHLEFCSDDSKGRKLKSSLRYATTFRIWSSKIVEPAKVGGEKKDEAKKLAPQIHKGPARTTRNSDNAKATSSGISHNDAHQNNKEIWVEFRAKSKQKENSKQKDSPLQKENNERKDVS
ncbi:hypothetical protein RIF29_37935 [Crotalaria pallida]|uniref:Uncharacterized protein n=1 Tax=Crotalaria pallida TaxID=3830 RepID=A0AAN9DYB2_CROPI